MALKKGYRCIVCDTDFAPYKWISADGHRHKVEEKTYYSPAKNWVTYVAEEKFLALDDSGKARLIPARAVQFNNGVFTTSDPEDQYALDEQCKMTRQEWEKVFFSREELVAKKERELKARETAVEVAENALLEQVKVGAK